MGNSLKERVEKILNYYEEFEKDYPNSFQSSGYDDLLSIVEDQQARIEELEGEKVERNKAIQFQAEIVQSLQQSVNEKTELAKKLFKMLEFLHYWKTKAALTIRDITPELNYIADLLKEAKQALTAIKEDGK